MKVRGVIIKGLVDIYCLGMHLTVRYTRKQIRNAGASIYLQAIIAMIREEQIKNM